MFVTTNAMGRVGCAGYVVGGSVAQAMWWVGRLRRLCGNYSDNNRYGSICYIFPCFRVLNVLNVTNEGNHWNVGNVPKF